MSENLSIFEVLSWLKRKDFDLHKKSYETQKVYEARMQISYDAFHFDYETSWTPLNEFADICPSHRGDRLPRNREQLGNQECYYLEIKNVQPENWVVPAHKLKLQFAAGLPTRATYWAQTGDIILSRFREPLGKCVVCLGEPRPLCVSSNFLLIRPKPDYSATHLLGLMKSPFVTCQIHEIIRTWAMIKEMMIYEAKRIRLPHLSAGAVGEIEKLTEHRISLEQDNRDLSQARVLENQEENHKSLFELYADVDTKITEMILRGI
jgi:hypothetical protein